MCENNKTPPPHSTFLFLSFSDLIQDWASDSAPDIYSFVPYSWKFKILFHQFEMIWAANQHNWIDCSTKQQENGRSETLSIGNHHRRSVCGIVLLTLSGWIIVLYIKQNN